MNILIVLVGTITVTIAGYLVPIKIESTFKEKVLQYVTAGLVGGLAFPTFKSAELADSAAAALMLGAYGLGSALRRFLDRRKQTRLLEQ